jgi:hypothetical protein
MPPEKDNPVSQGWCERIHAEFGKACDDKHKALEGWLKKVESVGDANANDYKSLMRYLLVQLVAVIIFLVKVIWFK